MKKTKMSSAILLALAAALSVCCKDDNGPEPGPEPEPPNTITINGRTYELKDGKYFSGFYRYMGIDCTNFYLEFTPDGAGITIELDENMVGETVRFEKSDTFWFFAIGNGQGGFLPLQHDRIEGRYSGWFTLDRNLETGVCSLLFELNRDGKELATGDIRKVFTRIPSP